MAGDIMRQAIIGVWLCIPIAPAAADTVTLRYGQIPSTVRSVSALYLSIAQQKGFFAREEVKLDLIPIAGGTDKMIAALDHGTVDVTQTATPYLIRAVLSGSDAVAIAGETANPVYSLIVKPQIQHFAELKGKTLGLSLPVDTISISMRKLLALKGLERPTIPSRNWWARRYVSIASSGESATRCRSVNPRISSLRGRATGDWVCRRRQWRRSNSRSLPRAGLGRRRTGTRSCVSCALSPRRFGSSATPPIARR